MRRALLPLALVSSLCWAAEPAGPVAPPAEPAPEGVEAAEPATSAEAPPPEPAAEAKPPALELSLKFGGHFPQLVSKLRTTFDASLTVGFAPLLGRRLQIFAAVGYSQPTHRIATQDPRLGAAGSDYTSTVLIRDVAATLGAKFFFIPPDRLVVPYAGLGFRTHFLGAQVEGNGGSEFGKYSETDTRFGGVFLGGVGIRLGPGLVLAEVAFDYSPIGQRVTGEANVGALTAVLGYGLMLF